MAVAPCPGLLSAFTAPRPVPVPAARLSTRRRAQIAPPPSPFSPNLLTLPPTHRRRLRRDPTLPPFSVPENGGASETLDESSSSSDSAEKENEAEKPNASYASSVSDAGSAVAEELKEMMRARRKEASPSPSSSSSSSDLWGGVSEEIREIEWPAFGKVVGTTSVVLAVIAGSTVALLTVNAVLAEISDRVFAGMGVQDFFG